MYTQTVRSYNKVNNKDTYMNTSLSHHRRSVPPPTRPTTVPPFLAICHTGNPAKLDCWK